MLLLLCHVKGLCTSITSCAVRIMRNVQAQPCRVSRERGVGEHGRLARTELRRMSACFAAANVLGLFKASMQRGSKTC